MTAFVRNRWPQSVGMPGRLPPESVAAILRNQWPESSGFRRQIEGPHRIQDGTLELGGMEATQAVVQRPLEEWELVDFDFFQEGRAGATLGEFGDRTARTTALASWLAD